MKNPSPTDKARAAASQHAAKAPVPVSRTRVKKLEAAPVGFSLEKYTGSEKFDAKEWAKQIEKRLRARGDIEWRNRCQGNCVAIERGNPLPDEDLGFNWSEKLETVNLKLQQTMSEIIETPLARFATNYLVHNPSVGPKSPRHDPKCVRPVTLKDLRSWMWLLETYGFADDDLVADECHQQVEGLSMITSSGRIVVNLQASDEDLMRAFREWLVRYRKLAGMPSFRHHKTQWRSEFQDWCKNHLLAYTDLRLWCDWRGYKLTKERLVDILYPSSDKATPSKLRAVERDAERYMQWGSVNALWLTKA